MTLRIISGNFKGKTLPLPDRESVRPTMDRIRENMFNILTHRYFFDFTRVRFLDAFAGSGILGLEALSRGAAFGVFNDIGLRQVRMIRGVLQSWNLTGRSEVIHGDLSRIKDTATPADLIFIDPPYQDPLTTRYLQVLRDRGWAGQETVVVLESEGAPVLPEPWQADTRIAGRVCLSFCTIKS